MSILNLFKTSYWIVHKPRTNKTYIISSYFSPESDYLYTINGILVCAGPFETRYAAECYLPTVIKELD